MKKQMKKLVLAKETLRDLGERDVHRVVGGEPYSYFCTPEQGTYWCASVRLACKDRTV